jgi:hypothetical protein
MSVADGVFKALSRFITRDLIYVVGGGSVVASFLYRFDLLAVNGAPLANYLLAGGIGYVVGYALQDGASVLNIVTTAALRKAKWPLTWLYCMFTHRKWKDVDSRHVHSMQTIQADLSGDPEYERIVTLKHIGTTGAPCSLTCAALLFWKSQVTTAGADVRRLTEFDIHLAWAALGLGVVLCGLAWIKAAQEGKHVEARAKRAKSSSTG